MISYIRILSLCVLSVLAPISAHAAVLVTEIMYDLPGTDSGREWIEITNTGGSAVDMTGHTLFEGNSAHALTLISGNAVLQPGNSAVIASNSEKFRVDWANYTGTLFDSSFSLSNGGETIEIRDGSTALDSVTYDPLVGARGDGNTFQRSGDVFIAASPTPGTDLTPKFQTTFWTRLTARIISYDTTSHHS